MSLYSFLWICNDMYVQIYIHIHLTLRYILMNMYEYRNYIYIMYICIYGYCVNTEAQGYSFPKKLVDANSALLMAIPCFHLLSPTRPCI